MEKKTNPEDAVYSEQSVKISAENEYLQYHCWQ